MYSTGTPPPQSYGASPAIWYHTNCASTRPSLAWPDTLVLALPSPEGCVDLHTSLVPLITLLLLLLLLSNIDVRAAWPFLRG